MSRSLEDPGYRITTREQAIDWIEDLLTRARAARLRVDFVLGAEERERLYDQYLVRQGSAVGVIMALHRAGLIDDQARSELEARAKITILTNIRVRG